MSSTLDRWYVSGAFGIDTTAPQARLHVAGGTWDLSVSEGDLKVGDAAYRLKVGVATGGGGAGDVRIRAHGGTNRLMLGSGTLDTLFVVGDRIGVGTMTPGARMDVSGSGNVSQCCAPVMPTLALSEHSVAAGRRAWLQFHNAGEAEAYLRLTGGGAAGSGREGPRRLEIGDSQGASTGLSVQGDISIAGKHALRGSDPWLRLNQDGAFTAGVHTPGVLAPGSLNVGGANGWGNPGGGNGWIAGSLAIGTTNQTSRLHVAGNGGILSLEGADHAYIQWYPRGIASRRAWMGFGDTNTNSFTIRNDSPNETNNAGRMHIYTTEQLYLLPGRETVVSRAWGGTGDLIVEGRIGVNGQSPIPRTKGWGGGIHTWDIEVEGSAWSRNGWQTGPRDLAENFETQEPIGPGVVVSFHPDQNVVVQSTVKNDAFVCGVVSTKPGLLLNSDADLPQYDGLAPVALCGRVPCQVVDENGPIQRGDMLTTSSLPGHAMRAEPVDVDGQKVYRSGTIVGKALEAHHRGRGVIDIFVIQS